MEYITPVTIPYIPCLLAIMAGLVLTRPLELRRGRYIKIGLTLILINLLESFFGRFFYGQLIILVALIWAGDMAYGYALIRESIRDGGDNRPVLNLESAYKSLHRKDLRASLAGALEVLDNDPDNEEAAYLAARMYLEMGLFGHARQMCKRMMRPTTTPRIYIIQGEHLLEEIKQRRLAWWGRWFGIKGQSPEKFKVHLPAIKLPKAREELVQKRYTDGE
jgi:hypothetical protein